MTLLDSILIISSCYFIMHVIRKTSLSVLFMDKFMKTFITFTSFHTSKEILKFKYSISNKTCVTIFDYSSEKKPRVLLENDAHVHFVMESLCCFYLETKKFFFSVQFTKIYRVYLHIGHPSEENLQHISSFKEWIKTFVALLTKEKWLGMNGKMMPLTFFRHYPVYIKKLGQLFFPYLITCFLNKDTLVMLKVVNIWTS